MYYTIYKITNQIDGKFYIGSHKTKDLDDKYVGSGKYLKKAIEKYGIENFTKEILFVFDTPELMYQKEAEIVNEEFLATENTYNLKIGGFGGWDWINTNPEKYLTEKRLNSLISHEDRIKKWKEKYKSDSLFREHIRNNAKKGFEQFKKKYPNGAFVGKTHSEETKRNMSEKAKKRLSDPTKNSQYGTMWITDGEKNKKILKTDPIPEGWRRGRVKHK
jgi:hypothetical protein